MFKSYLLIPFFLLAQCIWAQFVISGTVRNERGEAVAGANVTLSPSDRDQTLTYAITKSDGQFKLQLEKKENDLYEIRVRAMNYAFVSELVGESVHNFDFVLQEKAIELKEVLVKQAPIRQKGDTIAYDVSNFKDIQDRTIADVIKKMPGIEIKPSGQILYQGEPINKYYIEGMDLLGGRYALANENLSANAVDKVQILENHQPIKMLDSLVYSNKAALNIKLKNKITYSGRAEVGLGASPTLYQANITPMLFKKKQQVIGSFQANNRGDDISRQLRTFSLEDLLNNAEKFSEESWVNVSGVQTPSFDGKRWLDNGVQLGTWNHLFKVAKEIDLRFNISYINDYQKRVGETTTQYFLPAGDVLLEEQKRNHYQTESLKATATILRNSADNYLQNIIEFQGDWNRTHGYLTQNNQIIDQQLQKPNRAISNQFHIIKKMGKQLITFRSIVSYKEYAETLRIRPGIFSPLVNDSLAYEQAEQQIQFRKFSTNNYAEFTKGIKSFVLKTKAGFQFTSHQFESNLLTDQQPTGLQFTNDLSLQQFSPYLEPSIEWKKGDIRSNFALPMRFESIARENKDLRTKVDVQKVIWRPSWGFNWKLTNFMDLRASSVFSNRLSSLTDLHEGYIVYRYNSIQQNDGQINQSKHWSNSLRLEYKNPIKSIFANIGYRHSWTENELMYDYRYNPDASTVLQTIEQINHHRSHAINAKVSKYFSKIKTTVGLSSDYSLTTNDQLLNSELLEVNNRILNTAFNVKVRALSWITAEYDFAVMNYKNQLGHLPKRSLTNQQHQGILHLFPAKNHYIKMNGDYYVNDDNRINPNSFFADLTYRYTLTKKKIDFELGWLNIFNEKTFSQNSFSSNYEQRYTYKLRPGQFMMTTRFTF